MYVHLYDASTLDWHLEDGTGLKIRQETEYPWEGAVKLTVSPATAKEFTVFLRNPGWSQKTVVRVNGQPMDSGQPGHYLPLCREWKPGDTIDVVSIWRRR